MVHHRHLRHQHFLMISVLKPMGQLKPNYRWNLSWVVEQSLFVSSGLHDQDGRHTLIRWKPLKIFFSGTKWLMTLKLDMQHCWLGPYQVCSNGDPWLTFTYFLTRSNLVIVLRLLYRKRLNSWFFWVCCILWHQIWFMQSANWTEYQRSRSFTDLCSWCLRFGIFNFFSSKSDRLIQIKLYVEP